MYNFILGKWMMNSISENSTVWRATCQFPKKYLNSTLVYRDYVRARFKDFNIMKFNGSGVCKKVEYINIRGHVGRNVTVPFWQTDKIPLHADITADQCEFNATSGSKRSEDNFGNYQSTNEAFGCTESTTAATQYWFGGKV